MSHNITHRSESSSKKEREVECGPHNNMTSFFQNELQLKQSQGSLQNLIISSEDLQLFNRLKKMIDATVRLECAGCQKLIPTIQFYEHLLEQSDQDEQER